VAVVVVHQSQLAPAGQTASRFVQSPSVPSVALGEVAGHGNRAIGVLIAKRKRHVVITSPEAATDIFHNSKV